MKNSKLIIFIIILLSFAVGIYFYPRVPESIPSHWNIDGEVDGYMSRFWGLFLMPIISLAVTLIFILVPKIDPLKENFKKFRKHFDRFIIIILLFLFYLYFLTIFWALGKEFNMNRALSPAFAILFFYCGVLVQKSKRNWFIGIRTPWTLSSENVWNKTHNLGGKLFKIVGLIIFLGVIMPSYMFYFTFFPIIGASIFIIFYSYFEYRKEKNG